MSVGAAQGGSSKAFNIIQYGIGSLLGALTIGCGNGFEHSRMVIAGAHQIMRVAMMMKIEPTRECQKRRQGGGEKAVAGRLKNDRYGLRMKPHEGDHITAAPRGSEL